MLIRLVTILHWLYNKERVKSVPLRDDKAPWLQVHGMGLSLRFYWQKFYRLFKNRRDFYY
ncbi:hypothetical protein BABINDRAFT_160409 [Babjeviella inositovora NRRL Y-12698]|uniref:Uncharacterized protein n=1 Tax=Babjeviella inositovora NRRL Y-12698 TaxID=984486 RepID=A0A1E3QTF9_9ASCO|nr:uncharacterized protein BABINDRAFT_160409 [Babjeviella inositovora NRRL Y-12698]ODQ80986.1 hypothetical protein BABINDRAFT_160409 [Babjeviella inositovora NRRL Y-12698]